jgi:hypothetical protein
LPSRPRCEHPAFVPELRVQSQLDQIAAFKIPLEYEARAAGDMIGLDRHSPDEVVIVGDEGFEIPRLGIGCDAEPGSEVRREAGARQRQACEFVSRKRRGP